MSLSTGFLRYEYSGVNSFLAPEFNSLTSILEVKVNNVIVSFNIILQSPNYLEIINTSLVIGDIIIIRRLTNEISRIVDYNNGSILSEKDLDLDSNQLFYLIQETKGNIEEKTYLNVDNFNNNLTKNDIDVQTAFETLNNLTLSQASLIDINPEFFTYNFNNTILSAQIAFDTIDKMDIFNHSNNIKLQGAVENINSTSQFINASLLGKVYVPEGNWLLEPVGSEIEKVLSTLNNIECNGILNINLPAGLNILTNQVVINSSNANKIFVNGIKTSNTTIVSYDGFSGSVKNYTLTYTISDTSNIEVGDFVIVRQDITGTGNYPLHSGVWEVISVTASQISILNKSHSDQIDNSTVTSGSLSILKSVLRFDGCDGFRFEGSQPLGTLDNLCIKGDYSVSDVTGTTGCHGIITSSPVVTPGSDSNALFEPNGIVKLGSMIGITNFGEQGIACSGRTSMVANFVASCGNRKRGFYSEGANIRAKFSIANGNGEDGFIADIQGAITCSYAIASGNGLNGFWGTNNSFIGSAYGKAFCNQSDGIEIRGLGRGTIDGGICSGNIGNGVNVNDGGMVDADSCLAENNGICGFKASFGSVIDANNSISNNNVEYGFKVEYNSALNNLGGSYTGNLLGDYINKYNSTIIKGDGVLSVEDYNAGLVNPKSYDTSKTYYWQDILTSIGDLILRSSNGDWFTIKSGDGTFRPYNDNIQNLGDAAYRFKEIFAGNGVINTSDERTKTKLLDINEKETLVAKEIKKNLKKFKFLDSVKKKGEENSRIHFGVGAQTIKSIFKKYELDPDNYSLLCYDEWDEEKDDNGKIITKAGNRYGIRYEELLIFVLAAM